MKTKFKQQRGAVLVAALIMLSMVTFLVVALVGFTRSERASVKSFLDRHEIEFGSVEGQNATQQEVIDLIGENMNLGMKVSQNIDGINLNNVPTSLEGLVGFSKGLAKSPRPPVFVDQLDSNGSPGQDGLLDTFLFYWDLNWATDENGSKYQPTVTNILGERFQGDPHWIGILEDPTKPHGAPLDYPQVGNNDFVARYASMTVPVHKALNIRYHHNDLKGGYRNFDRYNRKQGLGPQEINLAAPLGGLHPSSFLYRHFNPLANFTSQPAAPSPGSLDSGLNSAFSYAPALSHFGYDVVDAWYLSRPSIVYNDFLDPYRDRPNSQEDIFNSIAARQLDRLGNWLRSEDPDRDKVHMDTPLYSYYQFMELFSATPLPVEPEKFDVNSIRDEIVYGTAMVNTSQPGLPPTFPGLSDLTFTVPHGLKDGDKLEWSSSFPSGGNPPRIYDPIDFEVALNGLEIGAPMDDSPEKSYNALKDLVLMGKVTTLVPHRLMNGEEVEIVSMLEPDPNRPPLVPLVSIKKANGALYLDPYTGQPVYEPIRGRVTVKQASSGYRVIRPAAAHGSSPDLYYEHLNRPPVPLPANLTFAEGTRVRIINSTTSLPGKWKMEREGDRLRAWVDANKTQPILPSEDLGPHELRVDIPNTPPIPYHPPHTTPEGVYLPAIPYQPGKYFVEAWGYQVEDPVGPPAGKLVWKPLFLTPIPNGTIPLEWDPDPTTRLLGDWKDGLWPVEFNGQRPALRYRYDPWLLDSIPHFVKVIDSTKVTLHRSAELDDNHYSKVLFCYPRSNFECNNGVFMGGVDLNATGGVEQKAQLFRHGDFVRTPGGGVFVLKKYPYMPLWFTLWDYTGDTPSQYKPADGPHVLQVVPVPEFHTFKHDGLTAAMEKMAGLMLNESLDTTGDGPAGPQPDEHFLGKQPLPMEEDPVDPVAPKPFPLKMGIGGHSEALGPWHHPKKGIPWGRGSASNFLKGKGRYTREMERIAQVAANIADLHSEPPGNISTSGMVGYPLFGKDLVRFSREGKIQAGMLQFGDMKSDSEISADIRQTLGQGLSGLGLGEYIAYFQPDETTFKDQKVRGRIYLKKGDTVEPVAASKELELDVLGPFKNPVTWGWNLNTLWPTPGLGKREYWVAYNLKMTCEAGRAVRAYFNGEEVLSYGSSKPSNPGQACLWSQKADSVFTNLKPWVELGKAYCIDFGKNGRYGYVTAGSSLGWSHIRYARSTNLLPTAYQGVFRRDYKNNIYLTGFQRNFGSFYRVDGYTGTSWYKRFGPEIIGVKDRSQIARRKPGHNLHAAITEVALRMNFDRKSQGLHGRLGMEVHVPEYQINLPGYAPPVYTINATAKIIGGSYVVVRTDGVAPVESPLPLNLAPYSMSNRNVSVAGRRTFIFNGGAGNGFWRLSPNLLRDGSSGLIPLSDGLKSLEDIRIENLKLHVEGEIKVGNRVVDYFNDTLEMAGPAKFANPPAYNSDWPFIPTWTAGRRYNSLDLVIDTAVNDVYRLKNGRAISSAQYPPSTPVGSPPVGDQGYWERMGYDLRKIEVSWQANDPLVNSHGSDFKPYFYRDKDSGENVYAYAPRYRTYDINGTIFSPQNFDKLRAWMVEGLNLPAPFSNLPGTSDYRLGVNLALENNATEYWGRGALDSSIKDPGVGYSYIGTTGYKVPHWDWRFPDISRGPIKNVGWLGQVHRGTPWQTLYLKSKPPGVIGNIKKIDDGVVTAPNHNLRHNDEVQLMGKCPQNWITLPWAVNGGVDAAGNIKEGSHKGYAQRLNANEFMIWRYPGEWVDVMKRHMLPGGVVHDTEKMWAQNIRQWRNWAASLDTAPTNDRRLLEVFSVGTGAPLRGRFSVNNFRRQSWSAVLSGLSVPLRTIITDGGPLAQPRILGANDPDRYPDAEDKTGHFKGRIDLKDNQWLKIVEGINAVRGEKAFTRVTDILATPELSDSSPYLLNVWKNNLTGNPDFKDELDLERIPMQLLSLLRVDDQPRFLTYICTQKLRPAQRVNIPGYSGPAISPDGTILNYEVTGQIVRRVACKLYKAKEWHQSIKNGIPGKRRDQVGNLWPLDPMLPIILDSSTLQMKPVR